MVDGDVEPFSRETSNGVNGKYGRQIHKDVKSRKSTFGWGSVGVPVRIRSRSTPNQVEELSGRLSGPTKSDNLKYWSPLTVSGLV